MPMACPHCGEHLLHKRDGALFCCRCSRVRADLEAAPVLKLLRSHGLAIVAALLCLPLACSMVLLDRLEPSAAENGAASDVR